MSETEKTTQKINQLVNQKDEDVYIKTDDILEIASLISSKNDVSDEIKQKLYGLIKDNLKSGNKELQKSTLILLKECLEKKLFNLHSSFIPALDIIIFEEIFIDKNLEDVDSQELWMKAFEILILYTDLEKEIFKETTRCTGMLTALKVALASNVISSPMKLKALKLLSTIIETTELSEEIIELYINIYYKGLLPSIFELSNKHQQLTIELTLLLIKKIPHKDLVSDALWAKYLRNDIPAIYLPVITKLVNEENILFSQLWILILSSVKTELHKNWSVCNSLLSIVEKAFKSPNFEVRKYAYISWQELINNFALSKSEMTSPKRIKLLVLPLKTNNCKTEELIRVKYQTWCKLINALSNRIETDSIVSSGVLETYLNFCFGPLGETPFMSYIHSNSQLCSPGRKFTSLHMEMCENLFKIIARKELVSMYTCNCETYLDIHDCLLTPELFTKISRLVIHAVGEASVLLSYLPNAEPAMVLNVYLWNALFELIDKVTEHGKHSNILDELSLIVLRMFSLAKRRSGILKFSVMSLFKIITTDKFNFCALPHMDSELYLKILPTAFKKDCYLGKDIVQIFEYLFTYKRNKNIVEYIDKNIDYMQTVMSIDCNIEKRDNIFSVWCLLGKEIERISINDKTVIYKFLLWAVDHVHLTTDMGTVFQVWTSVFKTVSNNLNGEANYLMKEIILRNKSETPISLFTISKFVTIIIQNLNYRDDLLSVVDQFYEVLIKPDIAGNCLEELQKGLEHIFINCDEEKVVLTILPVITKCLKQILQQTKSITILSSVKDFYNNVKESEIVKLSIIEHIIPVLENFKKCTVEPDKLDVVNHLIVTIQENVDLKNLDDKKRIKKKTKIEQTIVSGVDINTMTPVKMKGSVLKNMESEKTNETPNSVSENKTNGSKDQTKSSDELIFVDSPYKFDPKKLTKTQKAKLSRRRDDIPALYQDLSQSQTIDFSESNSEQFNESKNEETDERPFSQVNINNENVEPVPSCETPEKVDSKVSKRTMNELAKIAMSKVVGYEDHLKNIDLSSSRRTRNKIIVLNKIIENIDDKEEKLKLKSRGRPPKRRRTESDLVKKNSDDISSSEGLNPVKRDKSPLDKSPTRVTAKKDLKLNTTKVTGRRLSLESSGLDSQETVVTGKKRRRNSHSIEEKKFVPKLILCRSPVEGGEEPVFTLVNTVTGEESPIPEIGSESPKISVESSDKDTESVNSQVLEQEIASNCSEYENATKDICRKVILEKEEDELMDTQTNIEEPSSPEPNTSNNNIISSPVRFDTPTRNRELLKNTSEISPIKTCNGTSSMGTTLGEMEIVNTASSTSVIMKTNEVLEKSPELFSSETESVKEIDVCTTPVITKKHRSKFLQGRGAQMMSLLSPSTSKTTEDSPVNCTITKPAETKNSVVTINQRTSRISKMMLNIDCDKNEVMKTPAKNNQLNEDDFFQFGKMLPSPTASPRFSILRKRKQPDFPEDNSPLNKRKRVNFSDPPVSCRKFIEVEIRRKAEEYFKEERKETDIKEEQEDDLETQNNEDHLEQPTKKLKTRIRRRNLKPKILNISDREEIVKAESNDDEELEEIPRRGRVKKVTTSDNEEIIISPTTISEVEIMEVDYSDKPKLEPTEEVIALENEINSEEIQMEVIEGPNIILSTSGETENEEIPIESEISTHEKSLDNYDIDSNASTPEKLNEIIIEEIVSPELKKETIIETPTTLETTIDSPKIISDSETSPKSILDKNINESDSEHWKALADSKGTYDKLHCCTDIISNSQPDDLCSIFTNKNIKNIGDLAKLNNKEIDQIPVSSEVLKNILDNHDCGQHVKVIRKIKPTMISSPRKVKKFNEPGRLNALDIFTSSIVKQKVEKTIKENTKQNILENNIVETPVKSVSELENSSITPVKKTVQENSSIVTPIGKTMVFKSENCSKTVSEPENSGIFPIKPVFEPEKSSTTPVRKTQVSKPENSCKTFTKPENSGILIPIKNMSKPEESSIVTPVKKPVSEPENASIHDLMAEVEFLSGSLESENIDCSMVRVSNVQMNVDVRSVSPTSSSSNSPSPPMTPPLKWNSPSVVKDNILTMRVSGTMQDALGQLKNVLAEKKYDLRPILQEVFGGDITSPSYSNNLRIYHVAAVQKWDDIFSDIVACIGIKKLVRCILRLKTVPINIFFNNLYKSVDTSTMFQLLHESMTQYESPDLINAFQKFFVPFIIKNPEISLNISQNLSLVHLGDSLIEKLKDDQENRKMFLQKLNDKIGIEVTKDVAIIPAERLSVIDLTNSLENNIELSDAHKELYEKFLSVIPFNDLLKQVGDRYWKACG